MSEEKKSPQDMTYIKLFTSDIDRLEICFTKEQAGEWLFAINAYAKDGTVREVSPELVYPLHEYRAKIDAARRKYEIKCETNAKNGAKGGRAKAENAKRKAAEAQAPKFTPPTKTEYKAAIRHMRNEGDIDCDDCMADRFFAEMTSNDWKIGTVPIQSRNDWEQIIQYRFDGNPPYNQFFYWKSFVALTSKKGCFASEACDDFWDLFDQDQALWCIAGDAFGLNRMEEAIDAFLAEDTTA